jgi:hypothetical protein
LLVWSSVGIRRAGPSRRGRRHETIEIAKETGGVDFILRPHSVRRKRLDSWETLASDSTGSAVRSTLFSWRRPGAQLDFGGSGRVGTQRNDRMAVRAISTQDSPPNRVEFDRRGSDRPRNDSVTGRRPPTPVCPLSAYRSSKGSCAERSDEDGAAHGYAWPSTR